MDPALHVRRGHGQRCVFSARGVGTVCVRCVAEVLSLTDPEPLTQRDHPSVLALATTRARYARALAELVRDPAAGPDVADAWGHVLVAASVDAIVADDTHDPEAVTAPCIESVARLARTSARVDGGELLDAAVDRVLAHLDAPFPDASADEAVPAGLLGLPSPLVGASQHSPPARAPHPVLVSDPHPNPSATRRDHPRERDGVRDEPEHQASREDRLSSRQPPSPPRGADLRAYRDPRDAYRDSQSTASHAYRDLRESQNSVGVGAPALSLARRQPGPLGGSEPPPIGPLATRSLFEDRNGRSVFLDERTRERAFAQLLRLLAALLRLDLAGGDYIPSSFREPAPAQSPAPAPGVAAIAERLAAETAPPTQRPPDASRGDCPGFGLDIPARAQALETRLAALDAAAAFVARADAGNVAAIASLRAANAAAATALALGAAGAGGAAAAQGGAFDRESGRRFYPRRDLEDGLVLALEVIDVLARHCGVDLESMTSPTARGTCFSSPGYASAGWTNPRPSPLAETLNAGALFPSLAARAAACACLSSAVAGQSPAAVARLVRDDVLEHVFEVLRDAGRERSELHEAPGRTAHALAETRGAARAAQRGALACLMDVLLAASSDPDAAHVCSTRMAFGVDVLAATLARSVRARDAEIAAAAARLARAVAELGDPGTVPGAAAGRLADALLDAYDAFPADPGPGGEQQRGEQQRGAYHGAYRGACATCVSSAANGGASPGGRGNEPSTPPRAEVCAATAAMLAWPALADDAAGAAERGDRAETSARARRMFERLANDVARNLQGFGEDEHAREGILPRLGSPYGPGGGLGVGNARSFAWDLPSGAAGAMCAVLCDHFDPEDIPAAERILRECGMHEALAGALLRLAGSREAAVRRGVAPPRTGDVERAAAAAVRAFGSLLAGGAESRVDPTPFDGDPSESEATGDGVAATDALLVASSSNQPLARTRLARRAVERGVLAAALLAADARAPSRAASMNLPGGEMARRTEDDEEMGDGLLEHFVRVLLMALDDPGWDDAGRSAVLSGESGGDRGLGDAVPPALPGIPRGFGADARLTAVFAHVKYGDSDASHGAWAAAEAGRRLLAQCAPALAASVRSACDAPSLAADDRCLFAFAAAAAARGAGVFRNETAAETVDDAALETLAWRVAGRAREAQDRSSPASVASGCTAGAFASFAAFLVSGTPEAVRATDLLATAAADRGEVSPRVSSHESPDARRDAVASLLLRGVAHPGARRVLEAEDATAGDATAGDPPPGDPRKFLDGVRRSAAAVALLASRACARAGGDRRDTAMTDAEVDFAVRSRGPTRARWVGCDETNAAMDVSLYILRRRPATAAVREAAGRLWRRLGDAVDGPADAAFVDGMILASTCALVELDDDGRARSTAATMDREHPTDDDEKGGLASFAARAGPAAVAALRCFSPSGFQSSRDARRRAFGAAATARALATVLAGLMRKQTERDPRCVRVAATLVRSEAPGVSLADAACESLCDWHAEVVASPPPPPRAGDERDASDPVRRRLAREARRAAIDLVRVAAAAGVPLRDREHTTHDSNHSNARPTGACVVAILSDVADDPTDGVAALDALAAWALAETPRAEACGAPHLLGHVTPLVLQSGRAAMCAGSEAARDAGAACLWAALRPGEPGETSFRAGEEHARLAGEDGEDRFGDDGGGFEDVETGANWEASLLEDWLSSVEPVSSPFGAAHTRVACVSSTRPPIEGRLRLAATLARVAPEAFESKVARSPEAARRLFRRALSSGLPTRGRGPHACSVSPGALASLRALVDAGAARQLDAAELAGVRAACAEARHAYAEARRDEPRFWFASGATFSARLRGLGMNDKEAVSQEGNEHGFGVFGGGRLATATPRWFPRRGADALAALDALIADLDEGTREATR